jgi:DNA-directed RNA polymerase
LKIKYQQIKIESKKFKNKFIPTSKYIKIAKLRVPTYQTDKFKMLISFMPNFIHSLDAGNVHLLLKKFSDTDFLLVYRIHDCFASTPNNIAIIERKVKKAFSSNYFKDEGYLLKNHKKRIEQIKNSFEIKIERDK